MRAILTTCLLSLAAPLSAQEAVDYLRDIKPLLKERCGACHGALKQKAKLRLDTGEAIRRGGSGGSAITSGHPDKSLLIERITSSDESERMPPEGKPLSAEQIALLRRWIQQGAKTPANEQPESDPRQHWAFKAPVRPAVPTVKNAGWVRNPIDAFIAAEHEHKGLTPNAPADRSTLLRRVTIDLTGLPPTRAELQAYLEDSSLDAYEKVVDRLLASPRYAERWARHWMDVWRYSDWYGSRFINQLRNSRRHIWRWRDWIIESIDQDKGYDRIVEEMLAADELAPGDQNVQRATGYLGRSYYVFNRNVWLQDTVEYLASGTLALSMKCCRCHDHKYDPISQEDYYRLRAFFEPLQVRTDPIDGKFDLIKETLADKSPGAILKEGFDCVYDAVPAEATYLFARGNEKDPIKDRPIAPGVPGMLGGALRIGPVTLPASAYAPESVEHLQVRAALVKAKDELGKAKDDAARALAEKQHALAMAKLASFEARLAADRAKRDNASATAGNQKLAESASQAEREAAVLQAEADLFQAEQKLKGVKDAKALAAAQAKVKAAESQVAAARKNAQAKSSQYTPPANAEYPRTSNGRRLALARWLASKDNPLTARVAVNHLWLRHFGSAIVPSVQNFGRNGKLPSHPQLLDWLAVEFMTPSAHAAGRGTPRPAGSWSFKHLHRLIVTSNTYRMGSEQTAAGEKIDPDNRFLWRANVRRMEGEAVRDGLLHLSGKLDVTRGGPDLDPTQDTAISRRSLFFRHTPDEKPLILELFDAANPAECYERSMSIVPQQALALANGDFSHSQARLMARNLQNALAKNNDDAAFVTAAFELVLCRKPLPEELAPCKAFLQKHAAELRADKGLTPDPNATVPSSVPPSPDPALRARENLVHVLLNYNEFATIR